MQEVLVNDQEEKFLNYWGQRFRTIFEENTSWTTMFMTVNKSTFPETLDIETFCQRFIQEFNMGLSYKYDDTENKFDLTITR